MSYTKGQLVHAALEEIGIADYDFDVGPEQTESALRRLDAMMMQWNERGVLLSYPIGDPGSTSLDEDSNIPASAWEAVITNLAIRVAQGYGKQVSMETKAIAKKSLSTLLIQASKPRTMRLRSMPSGQGYKSHDRRFIEPEADPSLDKVNEELELWEQ